MQRKTFTLPRGCPKARGDAVVRGVYYFETFVTREAVWGWVALWLAFDVWVGCLAVCLVVVALGCGDVSTGFLSSIYMALAVTL